MLIFVFQVFGKAFQIFPFGWKVVVRECECHHVLVTCYIAMKV